jgi:hypothetical protein
VHKTVQHLQDGYKGTLAVEPDTGLFTAGRVTKAAGEDNHEAVVRLRLLADDPIGRPCWRCSAVAGYGTDHAAPRWPHGNGIRDPGLRRSGSERQTLRCPAPTSEAGWRTRHDQRPRAARRSAWLYLPTERRDVDPVRLRRSVAGALVVLR